MKTGECYFMGEDGNIWLAESFQDESGLTWTKNTAQLEEG